MSSHFLLKMHELIYQSNYVVPSEADSSRDDPLQKSLSRTSEAPGKPPLEVIAEKREDERDDASMAVDKHAADHYRS